MRVRDIMIVPPVFCTPEMPLQYVIHLLIEHDCSAVPVVEQDTSREPIGIVTGLGITTRMVAETSSPGPLQALDVMSRPTTVSPETSVAEARTLLEETPIRHLLVVDDARDCIGVVSKNALTTHRQSHNGLEQLQRNQR